MDSRRLVLAGTVSMREVDPRNAFVLPTLAKTVLVVKQRQFFYYIIHYQVNVNCGLIPDH